MIAYWTAGKRRATLQSVALKFSVSNSSKDGDNFHTSYNKRNLVKMNFPYPISTFKNVTQRSQIEL